MNDSVNKEEISKNFGLNTEEFEKLVQELKRNNEMLFERIFFTHFKDCISYVQRKYSATYNDAYDASMDAMLDFRMRLIDDKIHYGNLRFLFTQMATQFYIRNMKKYQSVEIQENNLSEIEEVEVEDLEKLKIAWNKLGEDCQSLLKLNFYSNMKLSAIAEVMEKSATSIRKQKERCLGKLINLFNSTSHT